MVDALRQASRVLVRDGLLVDLRPLPSSSCPIEVVDRQDAVEIGQVDALGTIVNDLAADAAIRHLVSERRFLPLHEARFDFEYYWDSVAEMAGFMDESRRMGEIRPSPDELARVHRARIAETGAPARLRARRPTLLAVYRKMARSPPVRRLADDHAPSPHRPS